jgi:hypothetical protein
MANGSNVRIIGHDRVMANLKKVSNADVAFDKALRQTASNSYRKLVIETQSKNPKIAGMNTGTTSRAWTSPFRVGKALYQVVNNYKNGKWNIARLINDGHGEIRPKKKFLYIPLTKRAAMKAPGANIPKGLVQGEDFVFALKVRAKKGTGYLDKNIAESSRELTQRVINAIRAVYR